jgi:hypothetical protein
MHHENQRLLRIFTAGEGAAPGAPADAVCGDLVHTRRVETRAEFVAYLIYMFAN